MQTRAPRIERTLRLPGPGGPAARPSGATERARDTRRTLARLGYYLKRQKGSLILTSFLVALTSGLDLMGPLLLGRAVDHHIIPRRLDGLWRIAGLMLLVYASSSFFNWLQNYVMNGASQRAVRDIRTDLFAKLQHLPLQFFDQRVHGELMSRLTNDVENINQVFSGGVTQIASGTLSTLCIGITMFVLNPYLAPVSLITVVTLTIVVNRWLSRRAREAFRIQSAALGRLYGFIEETIGGQHVVKAYNQERAVIGQFDAANREWQHGGIRAQIFSGFGGPLMNVINNCGLAIVAGVGGVMAVWGMATVGTIATFVNYTRQFGRPLHEIANLYGVLQAALAGAERVFEIIDEAPEKDAPAVSEAGAIEGEVVFEDVSFSYRAGTPVLRGVDLCARPGETIALIGPTGAGKTTIINLLTRFYEIEHGRISIDGRDIRDFPKATLRRQLGIVLQDTFLFTGTIRDNIRYGKLDATAEEIDAAVRLANADHFIERLPLGLDTLLTERGGNLSQGQRQLLAIARAILANPRILILDEATSSVDTRTERHIQEAMLRLMHGRTSFVIAHRLSTVRGADQILVIDRGEIVERGTHEELLLRNGLYSRLYLSQWNAVAGLPDSSEPGGEADDLALAAG